MSANFFEVIKARAEAHPDKCLATTLDGHNVSYGELLEQTAKVANALEDLGLKAGDRVSVQVEKSISNLWLYLGVMRAGMVFHPLNTAYALEEMRYFLGNAEPELLVCDASKVEAYSPLCLEADIPNLLSMNADGEGSFWDLVKTSSDQHEVAVRADNDLSALLYSSGTTGRPKGIMLSHKNMQSNAEVLVQYWGFTSADVLLHSLPIYHVHGLFVAIHCVVTSGASMHWLPAFDAKAVKALLPSSTVMMGVPTYYTRLLADPEFGRSDCASMRLFVSGSAPLLEETFAEFAERTGHTILERYGMSETGMNTSNPLNGERRAGTVGFPLPGTEVRICDADHNPLAVNEIGELEVRGPNVFQGYWRMPEKTAADFTADGWFVTGDQGKIDERGYVSIVGRSKDMVITGGLNVYPKEIELLLNDLDGVVESAVFGVPHPDFGEAVVATLVVKEGADVSADTVRNALDGQLAKFKIPKKVQFAASLPRNAMGKVQKNVLRNEWSEPF